MRKNIINKLLLLILFSIVSLIRLHAAPPTDGIDNLIQKRFTDNERYLKEGKLDSINYVIDLSKYDENYALKVGAEESSILSEEVLSGLKNILIEENAINIEKHLLILGKITWGLEINVASSSLSENQSLITIESNPNSTQDGVKPKYKISKQTDKGKEDVTSLFSLVTDVESFFKVFRSLFESIDSFISDIDKVKYIIEKIRCNSLFGNNETVDFEESSYQGVVELFDGETYRLTINTGDSQPFKSISFNNIGTIEIESGSGLQFLKFSNSPITIFASNDKLEKLKNYLEIASIEQWNEQINTFITNINNSKILEPEEVTSLYSILGCAEDRLNGRTRYNMIQTLLKSAKNHTFNAFYENAINELIRSCNTQREAFKLYNYLISNYDLLHLLIAEFHNIGGDANYRSFGVNLIELFSKGYSVDERQRIYEQLGDTHRLNFYGFDYTPLILKNFNVEGCKWSISTSFDKVYHKITINEKSITSLAIVSESNTNKYKFECSTSQNSYKFYANELIAISLKAGKFGSIESSKTGEPQVLLIPAVSYHILADSYNNQQLINGLDLIWGLVGIVTPVDEFYLLGQAIKLASKTGRSTFRLVSRLVDIKSDLRATKLVLEETPEAQKLASQLNKSDDYIILKKSVGADIAGKMDEGLEAILNKKLSDELKAHFINDYNKGGKFKRYFDEIDAGDAEGAIDTWEVVYKSEWKNNNRINLTKEEWNTLNEYLDNNSDLFTLDELSYELAKYDGFEDFSENVLGVFREVIKLVSSKKPKIQKKIDVIVDFLNNMGINDTRQINGIIKLIDLQKTVDSNFIVKKGSFVWRYERKSNPNSVRHFFIDHLDDKMGIRQVGFDDPSQYQLNKYKVLKDITVLETKIKGGSEQLISGELQNFIEKVSSQKAN